MVISNVLTRGFNQNIVDYLAKSLISLSVIPKICFDNRASGIIVKKIKT